MNIEQHFAKKMRAVRLMRGLSQAALARLLDWDPSKVTRLEWTGDETRSDGQHFGLNEAGEIAAALDVPLAALLPEQSQASPVLVVPPDLVARLRELRDVANGVISLAEGEVAA